MGLLEIEAHRNIRDIKSVEVEESCSRKQEDDCWALGLQATRRARGQLSLIGQYYTGFSASPAPVSQPVLHHSSLNFIRLE